MDTVPVPDVEETLLIRFDRWIAHGPQYRQRRTAKGGKFVDRRLPTAASCRPGTAMPDVVVASTLLLTC